MLPICGGSEDGCRGVVASAFADAKEEGGDEARAKVVVSRLRRQHPYAGARQEPTLLAPSLASQARDWMGRGTLGN